MKRRSDRTPDIYFWPRVKKSDGCWLWVGGKGNGYGYVWHDNRTKRAHRVSWEMAYGPIPLGLFVCHKCDTPLCVRPDHLFLGTAKDNIEDCFIKGRLVHRPNIERITCLRGHRFTGISKRGGRICHPCKRLRLNRHRRNKKLTGTL